MTWRADGPDTSSSRFEKSTKVYHILEIQNWESELSDSTLQGGKGSLFKRQEKKRNKMKEKTNGEQRCSSFLQEGPKTHFCLGFREITVGC